METTPVAEVSPTDKLAAAFERAGLKDDPEPPDHDEADEPEEKAEAADDPDPEAKAQPDDESDDATGADDGEEIEFEGEAYKLPKKLKDAFLRQRDYTQKTQQVAELRKVTEERADAIKAEADFNTAHFDKLAQAHALGAQLQQFSKVTPLEWEKLANEDPARYLKLDRQQRELQEAFNRTQGEIQRAQGEFQQTRVQVKQKAQALCVEALKKDFKDFGPDLLNKLDETGKSFGFSGEELASIVDPRMVRVLHAAMQFKKLQGSKSLIDKKVQDKPPVQVRAARSAQTSHVNAQLAELKTKAARTGKSADAEAYLAASFAKRMR